MLNNRAITKELKRGSIYVENGDKTLDRDFINITLGSTLKVYDAPALQVTEKTPVKEIIIPENGLVLMPNKLYIGATKEYTRTNGFVPMLTGNDELAVLGLKTHITAGFGDNGFEGTWTLEIECAMPTIVYRDMPMGCIYYVPIIGDGNILYRGKYFKQIEPTASKLNKEYEPTRTLRKVTGHVNNK
ncbi:MAG: dCTP deaminase [Bacilli bacterium]|jgi:dCTP deaminase|nr:dCTP deaminase [Bacilli bacterium]